MTTEGRGNAGLMDNEENQRQVSLVVHSPWKSLRDSHISTAPTVSWIYSKKTKPGNTSLCAVEKWKSKSTIPTFPPHLQPAAQGSRSGLRGSRFEQPRTTKGGLAADRFAPAFRFIVGLENANRADLGL